MAKQSRLTGTNAPSRAVSTKTHSVAIPAAPTLAEVPMLQSAVEAPGQATPSAILSLQRRYGNRAVQRLLDGHLQRRAAGAKGGELDSGLSDEIQHARAGGAPLDGHAGSQIASALGANFSGVTVHTDARADALNRAVSAKAFTTGSDIFFSKGAYAPGTHSGKQLLAHELTHVVQQNPTRVNRVPAETASPHPVRRMVWQKPNKTQTKLSVGPAGDRFEHEAEAIASRVMRTAYAPPPDSQDPQIEPVQQTGLGQPVVQRNMGMEVETSKEWEVWSADALDAEKSTASDKTPETPSSDSGKPRPPSKGTPVVHRDLFQMQAEYAGDELANLEMVTNPPGVVSRAEYETNRDGMIRLGQELEGRSGQALFNAAELSGGDPRFAIKPRTVKGLGAHLQVTIGVPLASVPALFINLKNKGVEAPFNLDTTAKQSKTIAANVAKAIKRDGPSPELVGLITFIEQYMKEGGGSPNKSTETATFPKGLFTVMARTDFNQMFNMLPPDERKAIVDNLEAWVSTMMQVPDYTDPTKIGRTFKEDEPVLKHVFHDPESESAAAKIGTTRGDWLRSMPQKDILSYKGKLHGTPLSKDEDKPEKLTEAANKLASGVSFAGEGVTKDFDKAEFKSAVVPVDAKALKGMLANLKDLYLGMGSLGAKTDVVKYKSADSGKPDTQSQAVIMEIRKPGDLSGDAAGWKGTMDGIYEAMDDAIKYPQGKTVVRKPPPPPQKQGNAISRLFSKKKAKPTSAPDSGQSGTPQTPEPQYSMELTQEQAAERKTLDDLRDNLNRLNSYATTQKLKLSEHQRLADKYSKPGANIDELVGPKVVSKPPSTSENPPKQPETEAEPKALTPEPKTDAPETITGVGVIRKPRVRSSDRVHWYQWSKDAGFVKTPRQAKKGTSLIEARPTPDPKFAWAKTPDFQAGGYLHTSNLTVTHWGSTRQLFAVDKNRLLDTVEGNKPNVDFKDTNREWFLDQAILLQAWRELKAKEQEREVMQDPEKQKKLALTQKQLALAMLNAFAKAAPVEQQVIGDPLGVQTSPLQSQAIYHRSSGGNPLLDQLRGLIAQDIKLPMESLQVLSDPLFVEVLAREFPVYGSKASSDGRVKVETDIDSLAAFERAVDAILANFGAGHAPSGTFVLNVTRFYQGLNCQPTELTAKVSRPLEGVLIRKTQAYISGKPGQDPQALVNSILNHVQVVALTKVKGVDVLLVPKLFKPLSAAEQKSFSTEEQALHKKVDEDTRSVFMQPGSHDDKKLDSAMIESGARLDPAAARAAMLEFASPEKLIGSLPVTKMTTSHLKTPTVAKDIHALLAMPTFTKFRALSTEKDAPPYQTMYPAATADLVAGLAKVNTKEGKLDEIFAQKQITDVLQHAYYRMLSAMAGASTFKGDLIQFMNNIEVIHDQLQMILGIAQPHSQDIDFSNSIKRQLQTAKDGKTTVPLEFDPKVHHKASAMHSVSSILSGVENEKEQREGTRALNALVLKDNYYEAHGAVLHNAKTYNVDELDGWTLKDDKGLDIDLVDKSFKSGAKPKGKIDIYICDFHHNISVERSEYKPENVTHQVDQLFKKGLVADRFTVAIDCTVDFLRSADVRNFLEVHKERITKGQLNLVLYRSAQKFDMLGMDNYYGGFTITINDSKSYNAFDKRLAEKEDQVKGLSHQGLTHLTEYGSEHLESYRQALMTNTRKLYDGLPAGCKGDSKAPLMIAKTEDPNNVFLDIQFPALSELFALGNTMPTKGPILDGFYNHFIRWAQAQNLAFTTRPSFGFATTNFTTIAGSKVRLNPGLESDESIKKYIAYFKKIYELLEGAQKEALAKRPKSSFTTEKEFTDFLDKISDEALWKWVVPKAEQVKPQSINKIIHPKGLGEGAVKIIGSLAQ